MLWKSILGVPTCTQTLTHTQTRAQMYIHTHTHRSHTHIYVYVCNLQKYLYLTAGFSAILSDVFFVYSIGTHTCTYIYTYIHIHTHTYTYIHILTHTYTYIHILAQVICTHICTYIDIRRDTCICELSCMYCAVCCIYLTPWSMYVRPYSIVCVWAWMGVSSAVLCQGKPCTTHFSACHDNWQQ